MGYLMLGLGIVVLGFGIFQFSAMFGLYQAQKDENTPPWSYWFLRTFSYISMAVGALVILYSLIR